MAINTQSLSETFTLSANTNISPEVTLSEVLPLSANANVSWKTILTGVSIVRSDLTGVWDRPVIVKLAGLSIEPGLPRCFLTLYDEAGSAINGATVKIEDANGTEQVDTTTDSSGKAYAKRLQYLDQPITLKIYKDGYQPHTLQTTVNDLANWEIALKLERVSVDQEMIL